MDMDMEAENASSNAFPAKSNWPPRRVISRYPDRFASRSDTLIARAQAARNPNAEENPDAEEDHYGGPAPLPPMIEPPVVGIEAGQPSGSAAEGDSVPVPEFAPTRRAGSSAPAPLQWDHRIAAQEKNANAPPPVPNVGAPARGDEKRGAEKKQSADGPESAKKKPVDLNAMDEEDSIPPALDPEDDATPKSSGKAEDPRSRPQDPRRAAAPAPSSASGSSATKPGGAGSGTKPSRVQEGKPTGAAVGAEGPQVAPIDLPSALRLAGGRDLDVALARERIAKSLAELEKAHALWLPSLYFGPHFTRQDGPAQFVGGTVQNVNKNSLHLGLTAAAGQSATGPIPAGGPAQVNGLSSILRISDAIFEPLAARQVVAARQANLQSATNDALLAVAEGYVNLQDAAGRVGIVEESLSKLAELGKLLDSQSDLSQRLKLDARRVQGEFHRQQGQLEEAMGRADVRSAELANRLRLDPRMRVIPVEPSQASVTMVPQTICLDDLVVIGLRSRPELSEAQWLVHATLSRLKQAKLRPFIPSLAMRFSGGGFGGGPNDFFGNFNVRGDTDISLFWQVENLGIGDRARLRDRASDQRTAYLQWMKVQDRVAAEIVAEHRAQAAAQRQIHAAVPAVTVAYQSADEVMKAVKEGQREPWEGVQAIQALAQARNDFLDATTAYNRAQFRLHRALGHPVTMEGTPSPEQAHSHPHAGPQAAATPTVADPKAPRVPATASRNEAATRPQVQPPLPLPQPRRIPLEHAGPPGTNTRALKDAESKSGEPRKPTPPDAGVRRTRTEEPVSNQRFSGLRSLFR